MSGYTFDPKHPKDPEAVLFHAHDVSDWLVAGETITEYDVVGESGITVDQVNIEGAVIAYRISGGAAGSNYIVTCTVTTSAGRTDERSARYRVRER